MSQHDLDIANQGFPATRADINNALQALGSSNSGATAPSTTYANQLWYDTANNILKIRNEDNDAWISLLYLDQTNDAVAQFDVDNIRIDGNTISSTDTNGDITLDPNGTGDTIVASDKMSINTTLSNWDTGHSVLQIGGNTFGDGSFAASDDIGVVVLANSYWDGSGYKFTDDGKTSGIQFADGEFRVMNQSASGSAGGAISYSQALTVDSSGRVLVKTTSAPVLGTEIFGVEQTGATAGCFGFKNNNTGNATLGGMWAYAGTTAGSGNYIIFYNGSGGTSIGSITHTASATSYNTSSDYRLKQGVVDMTGAIDRVKALAPKRFEFIADADTTVDGFLAHEAQAVVPEAVTGTHNEVEVWTQDEIDAGDAPDGTSAGDNKLDGDGNTIPVYQGIDQSKLVPLLTAALKESIAKIESLETRVAALEA